jgi:hypothetical protein
MDNRNMDPWLTSGACNLATAGLFKTVFSRHSNFFIGGDIEIGKLAMIMGYRTGFMDFTFLTVAPDTIRAWFKQRVIWFSGGIRHHVTNVASFGWYHFFILFYNSLLVYLLLPLRWYEFVHVPLLLPLVVAFSWLYIGILCINKGWKPVYLALPLYSFIQTMVILPLAVIKYLKLVKIHRSFGHLRHDLSRFTLPQKTLFRSLNFASAAVVLLAALVFTIEIIQVQYTNVSTSLLNSARR